jgi:hypothetical protein
MRKQIIQRSHAFPFSRIFIHSPHLSKAAEWNFAIRADKHACRLDNTVYDLFAVGLMDNGDHLLGQCSAFSRANNFDIE